MAKTVVVPVQLSGYKSGVNISGTMNVTVSIPDATPTPVPAGPPIIPASPPDTTPSPPAQMTGAMRSMWLQGWEQPGPSAWPEDIQGTGAKQGIINHVVVAMAQGNNKGGNINWTPAMSDIPAAISTWRKRGMNVVLGIGGSGDGGISLRSTAEAGQMFASVTSLVDQYGYNGIDIDIESGSWTESAVVSLVTQLKGKYGAGFVVGITPALYEPYTTMFLSLARRLGNNLDYLAPMLYDFPEAGRASTLLPIALDKIRTCVEGGVPSSKFVFGFKCFSDNLSTPLADAVKVWQGVKVQYPDIKGAFLWEHSLDAANAWGWTRTLAKTI